MVLPAERATRAAQMPITAREAAANVAQTLPVRMTTIVSSARVSVRGSFVTENAAATEPSVKSTVKQVTAIALFRDPVGSGELGHFRKMEYSTVAMTPMATAIPKTIERSFIF